jgi:hypothetical protein
MKKKDNLKITPTRKSYVLTSSNYPMDDRNIGRLLIFIICSILNLFHAEIVELHNNAQNRDMRMD